MITYNFRVDYYSRVKRCYTYKMVSVKTASEKEAAQKAIRKSRIKNIESVTLVSYTSTEDDAQYVNQRCAE